MVCIRCQKRPAIIFVQRMENGQMKNEGYCLHCARELHIKPVEDLMKQFGMSDEDMDNMEDRMENMMQELGDGSGSMNPFSMMMNMGQPQEDDDGDEDLMPGSSATFPLSMNGGTQEAPKGDKKPGRNGKKPPRRKFLDTYCENLTRKAKEGKLDDIIGRTDLIDKRPPTPSASGKYALLDFSKLLHIPAQAATNAIRHTAEQVHLTGHVKDQDIILHAMPAIEHRQEISLDYAIANTDRSVGAMLSGEIAKRYGNSGLPEHTLNIKFKGSAGQSFGAFLAHGVNFRLEGEANDYLGKGLSGGRISVMPPVRSTFVAENNTIAGNTLMYGATSGEVYINGRVGERFCVRNSGAIAVVEGVGDHGCEYMTGGRVVVLGPTGKNFAAGMSGGIAYVLDEGNDLYKRLNKEMVSSSEITSKYDVLELKSMIQEHVALTNSAKGKEVLDNFGEYLPKFKKIIPHDYERVLKTIVQMEEKGLSAEQAQIEAFYANTRK